MLEELIRLANKLDEKGLRKEADYLDKIIKTYAKEEVPITFENAKNKFKEMGHCSEDEFKKCFKYEGIDFEAPSDLGEYSCVMFKTKPSMMFPTIPGFKYLATFDNNPIEGKPNRDIIYLFKNLKMILGNR